MADSPRKKLGRPRKPAVSAGSLTFEEWLKLAPEDVERQMEEAREKWLKEPAPGSTFADRLDWPLMRKYACLHCTKREFLGLLGIKETDFDQALRERGFATFRDYIAKEGTHGKSSLRRAQYAAAMRGNSTMMLHLDRKILNDAEGDDNANASGEMTAEEIARRIAFAMREGAEQLDESSELSGDDNA